MVKTPGSKDRPGREQSDARGRAGGQEQGARPEPREKVDETTRRRERARELRMKNRVRAQTFK